MDTNNLILVLLTSSVVSAVISGLVSYIIQNRQVRNEYYKILLNKRLEAYLELEKAISPGLINHYYNENKYYEFLTSIDTCDKFNDNLVSTVVRFNKLFTNKTYILIIDLSTALSAYQQVMINKLDENPNYLEVAIKSHAEFEHIFCNLQGSINVDLMKLYKFNNLVKFSDNSTLRGKISSKTKKLKTIKSRLWD